MLVNYDITARGLSLPNALVCARLCKEVYDGQVGSAANIIAASTDTHVRITEQDDCVIVAFRGSQSVENFITDARAWREAWAIDGVVYWFHAGFMDAIRSVQASINSQLSPLNKPLVLTGHSLGGALAVLYAFVISRASGAEVGRVAPRAPLAVYTFGQPRVGDKNSAACCGEQFGQRHFRFEDCGDCGTRLPGWLLGYRHSGQNVFLNARGGFSLNPVLLGKIMSDAWEIYRARNSGPATVLDLLADHHIDRYVARIAALQ